MKRNIIIITVVVNVIILAAAELGGVLGSRAAFATPAPILQPNLAGIAGVPGATWVAGALTTVQSGIPGQGNPLNWGPGVTS
jgi:hypothetical protein